MIMHRMTTAGWLLGAALALGPSPSVAIPGPMQVEEPETRTAQPPIQPEKDKESWKTRKSATLTASQKAALKTRQETMKDMVALIQKKRRAIREARPEDRQALALELHKLILEQTQGAKRPRHRVSNRSGTKGADVELDASARTQGAGDQKTRSLEQKEEILRKQELHRQFIEEKLKALEIRNGNAGGKKED